jgi:peptidoglycan/xylan/chitin deacetylase (PgdA/CDA1 family)
MKSHLRKIKIAFFIIVSIVMAAIFVAQRRLSLARLMQEGTDPMKTATEKKFAYLKNVRFEDATRVLGATTATRAAESIKVLYYHGISETENKQDVSFSKFKEQMYALKKNGFETITTQQLEDYLLHGAKLPQRSFLLTFDDGRKDSFYPVDPVLKALNYHAVMFLIDAEIQDRDMYYLDQSEISEMLNTGRWEIQAHTLDSHKDIVINAEGDKGHALINKLWLGESNRLESDEEYRNRIYNDLFNSKKNLETKFSVPIKDLAYPFGDYGQGETNYEAAEKVIKDVVEKLYRFSYFQPWEQDESANFPHVDTKKIKRIGVESKWSGDDLLEVMLSGEGKQLPYTEAFSDADSWLATWGELEVATGSMKLISRSNTTGASALLAGSERWTDFSASVSATLTPGTESFSILGRISEELDYIECAFTTEGISYKEKSVGKSKTYEELEFDPQPQLKGKIDVVMTVFGNKVICGLADNSQTLKAMVRSANNDQSRFGLSVWGSKKGTSKADVTYLHISNANE